jgi:hypothetical protein
LAAFHFMKIVAVLFLVRRSASEVTYAEDARSDVWRDVRSVRRVYGVERRPWRPGGDGQRSFDIVERVGRDRAAGAADDLAARDVRQRGLLVRESQFVRRERRPRPRGHGVRDRDNLLQLQSMHQCWWVVRDSQSVHGERRHADLEDGLRQRQDLLPVLIG